MCYVPKEKPIYTHMKIIYLVFIALLASCASKPALKDEVKFMAAQPVSVSSEDFSFSELILILKVDHYTKTISKCEGVFPSEDKREELIKLYFSHKVNKKIKFERKQMVSLIDKQQEIIIYSLYNDSTLSSAVSACQRLTLLYQQEGFEIK